MFNGLIPRITEFLSDIWHSFQYIFFFREDWTPAGFAFGHLFLIGVVVVLLVVWIVASLAHRRTR